MSRTRSSEAGFTLAALIVTIAIMTIANAVALLLLPMGREHFARLLATGCLIVLAICYAGVLLVPHLSIHLATDIAEPVLAGAWRGAFEHKNGAGATMVLPTSSARTAFLRKCSVLGMTMRAGWPSQAWAMRRSSVAAWAAVSVRAGLRWS